ncbi:ABC transporter substrate-binding protein [Castellaniella defragrans]|uniref:Iron complex transport system substrate-binding protein n=1 Tax=Castellaniella defragrans TaxID=75697 RepID=A0A7W9TPG8_CASDE|nr:ABC transporter substrate-binding protein [Castellaniella defragrans]MBB6083941.1 iron complex transport system substrate-binding protein [Castellaniella defragrans]
MPGARRRFCLLAALQGLLACVPDRAMAGSAPRVACIDWAAAESLAWLGCMPVAVPDLVTYRRWLPEPALPATTIDLGMRNEPNLELLAAVRPDRILLSSWQAGMRAQFSLIAPVDLAVVFDERRDPWSRIRELLLQAGGLAEQAQGARQRLAGFDEALAGLRRAVSARPRRPVYVAVLDERGSQAFVYGKGSWVDAVMDRIGLRNAWSGPTSFYGNSLVEIARFAADAEAAILYLDQGDRTRRAEANLRASTLWRGLPAVAAGRVAAVPAFYPLGGIPSALRCARILADAVRGIAG